VVHIHVQHAGIAGVTDCAQHDVQRIERKNTFLPSRLCSRLIAELRGQNARRVISDSAAITAMAAPLTSIWLPAASLKLFSDFSVTSAASAAAGELSTFGGDLGIRTQRQLIGSNQFDDAIYDFSRSRPE